MKRLLVFLSVLIVLCGCSAPAPSVPTLQDMSASSVVDALIASGFPIENVIVYDEATDVNELLGRPGQYIEKVSFADGRVEQYDPADPLGGTIEIFKTKSDCDARRKYIQSVFDASPLFAMYMYQFGTVLARFEYALTPSDAAQYETALGELYKNGVITSVSISAPAVTSPVLTTPAATITPTCTPSPVSTPAPSSPSPAFDIDLISSSVSDISVTVWEPNSAGGVDIRFHFRNCSDKTIKYVTVFLTPYNAVDDVVFDEIDDKATKGIRITGPGEPGESFSCYTECLWYNSTIKRASLYSFSIEYMDGSVLDIPNDAVQFLNVEYKKGR